MTALPEPSAAVLMNGSMKGANGGAVADEGEVSDLLQKRR